MPYYAARVQSTVLPDKADTEWTKLTEGQQLAALRGLEAYCRDAMVDRDLPHWSLMVVDAPSVKDAWGAITRKSLVPDLHAILKLGAGDTIEFDQLMGEVWIPVGTSGHLVEGLVYVKPSQAQRAKKPVKVKVKLGAQEFTLQGFLSINVRFDVVKGFVP